MYTLKTVAEKTNLSIQTLYKMISEERALGVHFKKNALNKWVIDENIIDDLEEVK